METKQCKCKRCNRSIRYTARMSLSSSLRILGVCGSCMTNEEGMQLIKRLNPEKIDCRDMFRNGMLKECV